VCDSERLRTWVHTKASQPQIRGIFVSNLVYSPTYCPTFHTDSDAKWHQSVDRSITYEGTNLRPLHPNLRSLLKLGPECQQCRHMANADNAPTHPPRRHLYIAAASMHPQLPISFAESENDAEDDSEASLSSSDTHGTPSYPPESRRVSHVSGFRLGSGE